MSQWVYDVLAIGGMVFLGLGFLLYLGAKFK